MGIELSVVINQKKGLNLRFFRLINGNENYICQKELSNICLIKFPKLPVKRLLKQHFCRTAVVNSKG